MGGAVGPSRQRAADFADRLEFALAAVCDQEAALSQLLTHYLTPEERSSLGVTAHLALPPIITSASSGDAAAARNAELRRLRCSGEEARVVKKVAPMLVNAP